ncbi:M24 family metallopeptidase [Actinomadura sp. SCN-SB]|uniref:M24 family metallopeptidase n=1 Tax=Actinomadura sp. SCN-SB TaxID=3373092 RepID=UPI003751E40C
MTAETSQVAAPFTAAAGGIEHGTRIAGLRARMAARGIGAVAVASPENIYYLTGLDHLGYFAFTLLVVPAEGAPIVVTRDMERATVRAQLPWCRHLTFHDGEDPAVAATAAIAELVPRGGSLAIEDESMFFPPSIRGRLRLALRHRGWLDATAMLAEMRAVKSPAEVEHTRAAARVSRAAMDAGLATARPGVAERQVATAIWHAMYASGGQQPGFEPLIRPLSMLDQEHVSWGERELREGDGLFIELSGCVRRYHAPMSRTLYLGDVPDEGREAHAAASAGFEAALEALRPGALTGEVYAAWRRAVAARSSGARPSRHHCGYLVGIGFPPSWVGGGEVLGIRPDGRTEIVAGMTFHLMSWVTRPAGHALSDTALVTDTGAELLTGMSRGLLVAA